MVLSVTSEDLTIVVVDSQTIHFGKEMQYVTIDVYAGNEKMAAALKCFLPDDVDIDDVVPHYNLDIGQWVLVDQQDNTGYVTTYLPHLGTHKMPNYFS